MKCDTPLVSIIIPSYNAERWIGEALESALAQTWPAKEIIVVNDGSTDRTLEVLKPFVAKGVRVISQSNSGASRARNIGLAASKGDYIQYLDADDVIAEDKIEKQLKIGRHVGPDYLLTTPWARFEGSVSNNVPAECALLGDFDPATFLRTKYEVCSMMASHAWLTSRKLVDVAGGWDESLSLNDDGEYFDRLVSFSRGVRFCEDTCVFYRMNISGSLSVSSSDDALDSLFRSIEKNADHMFRIDSSCAARHAVAVLYKRFQYEAFPQVPRLRNLAIKRVAELGGCDLQPPGGVLFHKMRKLIGWKCARRLTRLWMKMRNVGKRY